MPYPQPFVSNTWNNASQDDLISYMEKQNHARSVISTSYKNYISDLKSKRVYDASERLKYTYYILPEQNGPMAYFDPRTPVPYTLGKVASDLACNTGFDQVGLYKMLWHIPYMPQQATGSSTVEANGQNRPSSTSLPPLHQAIESPSYRLFVRNRSICLKKISTN